MKYAIKIHSPEHSKAVQERLFELGCKWFAGQTRPMKYDIKTIASDSEGLLTCSENMSFDDARISLYPDHTVITLDDLYQMSPEDLKPKNIVKLNDRYTAEIIGDTVTIKLKSEYSDLVDSSFDIKKVKEIIKTYQNLNHELKAGDRVRIKKVEKGCNDWRWFSRLDEYIGAEFVIEDACGMKNSWYYLQGSDDVWCKEALEKI